MKARMTELDDVMNAKMLNGIFLFLPQIHFMSAGNIRTNTTILTKNDKHSVVMIIIIAMEFVFSLKAISLTRLSVIK